MHNLIIYVSKDSTKDVQTMYVQREVNFKVVPVPSCSCKVNILILYQDNKGTIS